MREMIWKPTVASFCTNFQDREGTINVFFVIHSNFDLNIKNHISYVCGSSHRTHQWWVLISALRFFSIWMRHLRCLGTTIVYRRRCFGKPTFTSFCESFLRLGVHNTLFYHCFSNERPWLNRYTITVLLVPYPKIFVH